MPRAMTEGSQGPCRFARKQNVDNQLWQQQKRDWNINVCVVFVSGCSNFIFKTLWITFVDYSAHWRGVGFCSIKMGRSNLWA